MTQNNQNTTSTDETTAYNAAGTPVLRRLILIAFMVVGVLIVLDIAARLIVPQTDILSHDIDIQSSAMLYTKIEELRQFDGVKIAVLGDSLVFGRTMRDHGNADWQDETIAAQLEKALSADYAGCPVKVVNLGMNGLLPRDLDRLMAHVMVAAPDVVMFDVSLRSFSRDFDAQGKRMSRPWLGEFSVSDNGVYNKASSGLNLGGQTLETFLINHWYLYRIRDVLQAYAFDGQPADFTRRLRDRLDKWFKGEEKAVESGDDLMLLFKARGRYDGIDLADDNPQKQALDRIVVRLKEAEQSALGFYATEDDQKLEDLIERDRFDALQSQLSSTFEKAGDHVKWVGPLSTAYDPEHYLDHVHLDAGGYNVLVSHLLPKVKTLLSSNTKIQACKTQ